MFKKIIKYKKKILIATQQSKPISPKSKQDSLLIEFFKRFLFELTNSKKKEKRKMKDKLRALGKRLINSITAIPAT